jgi:hypothetical protein
MSTDEGATAIDSGAAIDVRTEGGSRRDGSSIEDARPEGPATDIEAACASYSKAHCAHDLACRVREFRTAYGALDVCVARTARICADEVTSGGSTITLVALTGCAEALMRTACPAGVLKPIAACAFAGKLTEGTGCRYASQCQSGYCERNSTWCGVCRGQVGIGAPCKSQLACAGDSVVCTNELKCAAQIAEGGVCKTSNFDCALDLVCNPSNVCQKTAMAAGACRSAGDCAPESPLGCANKGAGMVCTPVTFAGYGEPCNDATPAVCTGMGDCRASDGTLARAGTCSPPAPDGQTCDLTSDTGRGCLQPSLCVNGVCEFPAKASTCP